MTKITFKIIIQKTFIEKFLNLKKNKLSVNFTLSHYNIIEVSR